MPTRSSAPSEQAQITCRVTGADTSKTRSPPPLEKKLNIHSWVSKATTLSGLDLNLGDPLLKALHWEM